MTPAAHGKPALAASRPRARAKAAPATPEVDVAETAEVPAAEATKAAKETVKLRLVSRNVAMSADEYAVLADVKKACGAAGFPVKKSELLRIGVGMLTSLPLASIQTAMADLAPLKRRNTKKK
ncbi:MAG: hypothetical protein V4857_31195 [Pseudomonadota bacterium]